MGNAQPRFGGYQYAGQSTHSWQEKACFEEVSRVGGPKLCQGAALSHIDLSGCWRKNFRDSGRFGFCLARMRQRCSGRRLLRCDKPGTLQKSRAKTGYAARHQNGLQIAEGMVTFFDSYERELEKYWTKTLFFQRPLPDSSDAHKGRGQKLPERMCIASEQTL